MPNIRWHSNVRVAAHAYLTAAEFVLEATVEALHGGALAVAALLGVPVAERALGLRAADERHLHLRRRGFLRLPKTGTARSMSS